TTGGALNPPLKVKLIWGGVLAGTEIVLLWSGGLSALEMAMLIAEFPFTFVVILLAMSLFKALRNEHDILELERKQLVYEPDYIEQTQKETAEKRIEFEETHPDETEHDTEEPEDGK